MTSRVNWFGIYWLSLYILSCLSSNKVSPHTTGWSALHTSRALDVTFYSVITMLRTTFFDLRVHCMHITPLFTSPLCAILVCPCWGLWDILGLSQIQVVTHCLFAFRCPGYFPPGEILEKCYF